MRFVDKYRPASLSKVVGQDRIVQQLEGLASEGKLAGNTILLSGPFGVGKTTIARILGRMVNCEEGGSSPCGECRSCKLSIDSHPDIVEVNGAETRGIDDIRSLIDMSRLTPRHHVRVFILDEMHQLTGPAAQAFLKELEEPKSHVLYILCTTEPYKLLPTIRSRSSWLKLSTVSSRDVARLLRGVCKAEGIKIGSSVIKYLASLSDGHVRDALTTLDQISSSIDLEGATDDDLKSSIPELLAGIIGESPSYLVPRYTKGLLGGTLSPLICIRKVDNLDYFLGLVVTFLKEFLVYNLEPGAVDNKGVQALKSEMDREKKPLPPPLLLQLLEYHLDLQERLKRHLVSPLDAFDAVVIRSSLLLSGKL